MQSKCKLKISQAARKYTNDQRASIIQLTLISGLSTYQIAGLTGISERTIRDIMWRDYYGKTKGPTVIITLPSKLNEQ